MLKYQFDPKLQLAQDKIDNMKTQVEKRRRSREQIEQLLVLDNRIKELNATKTKINEHTI
jgi:hypothetical protein